MTTLSSSVRSRIRRRIIKLEDGFKDEMKRELVPVAKKLVTKFRRVVSDWQHKPSFSYRITVSRKAIRLTVFPRGENRQIFLWVDQGTEPHIIRAKNVPFLRFQTGYSARTQPIAKYRQGDGKSHGDWASAQVVNHPGTEARDFGATYKKDMLPDFQEVKENAFKRAVQRAKRG